jgi:hypothetical protein
MEIRGPDEEGRYRYYNRAEQRHVQRLTEAFHSPPCRDDDVVPSSVGSRAVYGGEASVGNAFVSPPIRDEYLQNVHREEPTTWQGFEARRLHSVFTATGVHEIARELMQEFDQTAQGDMCAQTLRQYSNLADAPSRKRGEVGSEDEHTASPNRNTRNANRNAGSSSSYWGKRRPDADRIGELEDANTTKPVVKGMRECKRGCGSTFMVRGVQKSTSPVEEIMNLREVLCTLDRVQLRNMLYGFLRHEGGGGLEVPGATKDPAHMTFTVKTAFFTGKMCLTCMAAMFSVSSPL